MTLIEHRGKRPTVAGSAWVAPTAVLCGDVTVGEDARVLFGAVLSAEGGPVSIGARCIVMEHAVLRGREGHAVEVGDHSLIGPHAHVNGARLGEEVFIATGASVFPGARIGAGAEVRINGVVHINTVLAPGATVPIGWIAVGDPARVLAPDAHEAIWTIQKELDFPGTVFGLERPPAGQSLMPEAMRRYADWLAAHRDDRALD